MAMSTERKAERAAARKRERELAKLESIASNVNLIGDILTTQIEGCIIQGFEENFNKVIEKLGYRPVRVTENMLNPGRKFCIDINTPSYCDPGCEAYHSM
jgi:hypothetical protein